MENINRNVNMKIRRKYFYIFYILFYNWERWSWLYFKNFAWTPFVLRTIFWFNQISMKTVNFIMPLEFNNRWNWYKHIHSANSFYSCALEMICEWWNVFYKYLHNKIELEMFSSKLMLWLYRQYLYKSFFI